MIKQNYLLTEEEKKLILKQHLEATKNHYIMEQSTVFGDCFKQIKVGGAIDFFADNDDYKHIEVTWDPGKKRKYIFYKNKSYNSSKIEISNNQKNYTYQYTDNWYCDGGQLYIKSENKYFKVQPNFSWILAPDFQPSVSPDDQTTTTTTTVSPPLSSQQQSVNKPTFKEDNDGEYSIGSINPRITELQNVLNLMGKTDFEDKELVPDGKFGKRTLSALKQLTRYTYFKENDKITDDDIEKIIERYNKKKEQTTQSTEPTPTPAGTPSDSTTGQSTSTPDTSTTGLEVTINEL